MNVSFYRYDTANQLICLGPGLKVVRSDIRVAAPRWGPDDVPFLSMFVAGTCVSVLRWHFTDSFCSFKQHFKQVRECAESAALAVDYKTLLG